MPSINEEKQRHIQRRNVFRFEASWARDEGYEMIIKAEWLKAATNSKPLRRVPENLKSRSGVLVQ